jgi:hypothetical protein
VLEEPRVLHRHHRLVAEGLDQADLVVGEDAPGAVVDEEHAEPAIAR